MKRLVAVTLLSLAVGLPAIVTLGGRMAWPAAGRGDAGRGETLFAQKCAVCHGPAGRGDGPAEFVLFPKPRDLTSGKFKIRSTPTLPTDDDLFRVVSQGIPGTAMPSWSALAEAERWDLVAYMKTLSSVFREQAQPAPASIPATPKPTPALLALGKKFYAEAECLKCHGAAGRGDGESADSLQDEWGYPVVPYDFTTAGRMKGGNTVRDVYRTLRNGIGGTPMPSYADSLSEEETWALAYYVLSLAARPGPPAAVENGTVHVHRVAGPLPADPNAAVWRRAALGRVPLRTLWLRPRQVAEVRVAALHDGRDVGFLLEWDDPIADQAALGMEQFRDAAAVQFPVTSAALGAPGRPEPSYVMGDRDRPVNLWHWKADWQLDVARFRDREDRFARVAVDSEPFAHDPLFLTGRGAGNPMSQPRRSAVENLNASGVGTITSQPSEAQVVRGEGRWSGGVWRVVMIRAMKTENPRDAQFAPGDASAIAFAIWDGAQRDRNGQKAVSVWQRLLVSR